MIIKVVLSIVAGVIVVFAIYVAMEAMSDDEYYASSIGLSIRETLGERESEATERCSRRVPKKPR